MEPTRTLVHKCATQRCVDTIHRSVARPAIVTDIGELASCRCSVCKGRCGTLAHVKIMRVGVIQQVDGRDVKKWFRVVKRRCTFCEHQHSGE